MINNFDRIAPNDEAMRPVIVDGREWDLCTIGKYDKPNQTDDNPRAEYRSKVLFEEGNTYSYGFDIQIPEGWSIDEGYTSFTDLHARHVSLLYLSGHIVGDEFQIVIKDKPGTAYKLKQRMKWIPDYRYKFRITTHISNKAHKGYIKVVVNGYEWIYYTGSTLFEGDENPYWKAGLYIGDWDDRHKTDSRKILLRV